MGSNPVESPEFFRFMRQLLKLSSKCEDHIFIWLLLIVDKIQRAIESGHFSCGIFLDLRKALDTVDHDILLAKLYSYGFRGTPYDWFVYLSNRSQVVSIGKIVGFS